MARVNSCVAITASSSFCVMICCLVCCAIPGIVGIAILNRMDWPTVPAELIDKELCPVTSNDSDEEPTYYLTFEFTTLEGEDVTTTTGYCTSLTDMNSVRYNPENPEDIIDGTTWTIVFVTSRIAAGIGWTVGIIACIVGICVCVGVRKQGQNNNHTNTLQTTTNIINSSSNNNTGTVSATVVASEWHQPPVVESEADAPKFATAVAIPTGDDSGSNYGSSYPVASTVPLATSTEGPVTRYKGSSTEGPITRYK